MFNYDIGRKCLIAEGWCPKNSTEHIVAAMRQATESSGALVPSILSVIKAHEEPPTYFRTNKFTESYQAIVEAYAIAHYREINPGVFTIITFPFLFAVMFGDFGHGIIMTLVAIVMIKMEQSLGKQKLNEVRNGRDDISHECTFRWLPLASMDDISFCLWVSSLYTLVLYTMSVSPSEWTSLEPIT